MSVKCLVKQALYIFTTTLVIISIFFYVIYPLGYKPTPRDAIHALIIITLDAIISVRDRRENVFYHLGRFAT